MKSLTPIPSPKGKGSDYSQNTKTVEADITPLSRWRGAGVRILLAVAAAVALFFVVQPTLTRHHTTPAEEFANVELAFNNLSVEDQNYLLQVYEEEDILMDDLELNL